MTYILDYDRKRNDLIELASIDESTDYEVDCTEIHYDPKTLELVLLIASGCSCWDGDYDEERFKTLTELKMSLLKDDREYNPSFSGAEKLIKEAERKYYEIIHR